MEITWEELEPMSPFSQYLNSSAMSVCIVVVVELETLITPSEASLIITDVLLPANSRFTSILVKDENGAGKWKRVEVNPEDHIYMPSLEDEFLSSIESRDACFNEYLKKLSATQFSESKPLWEIHVFKYPTSSAICSLILKIHHSIGDGFSLMSMILSFLKRADDPFLPITFPSTQRSEKSKKNGVRSHLPHFFVSIYNMVSGFGWNIMKSTFIKDDPTPIKSSGDFMELTKPIAVSTMTFSLDQIKEIKNKLEVTINDVLSGIIFLGIRLYMQEISPESGKANSTALILQNTRKTKAYKSMANTKKSDLDMTWGNKIAFLPVSIPKLNDYSLSNPLEFVKEAQKLIMKQRSPLSILLYDKIFDLVKQVTGIERGARLWRRKLENSSISISNMIGPIDKVAFANHSVKGLYFTLCGVPQSLYITIVSYMGDLRLVITAEECFIDQQRLKSCIEDAFNKILKTTIIEVSS